MFCTNFFVEDLDRLAKEIGTIRRKEDDRGPRPLKIRHCLYAQAETSDAFSRRKYRPRSTARKAEVAYNSLSRHAQLRLYSIKRKSRTFRIISDVKAS